MKTTLSLAKMMVSETEPESDKKPSIEDTLKMWVQSWPAKETPTSHCLASYKNQYWDALIGEDEKVLLPLLVREMQRNVDENCPMVMLYERKVLSGGPRRKSMCALDSRGGNSSKAREIISMWNSGTVAACSRCGKFFHVHESARSDATRGMCSLCLFT
jgi:hypothetical protein